jgi:hypothetical protein
MTRRISNNALATKIGNANEKLSVAIAAVFATCENKNVRFSEVLSALPDGDKRVLKYRDAFAKSEELMHEAHSRVGRGSTCAVLVYLRNSRAR